MVNATKAEITLLLTLIVPRALEDEMADVLMQLPQVEGFTQDEVRGFSRRQDTMTTAEQVAGRQNMTRFELYLAETAARQVMAQLAQYKSSIQVHFALTPLLAQGHGWPLAASLP
jgi:hypothetical protein